jgi:uncharacterized membrane protein (DUF441 family)
VLLILYPLSFVSRPIYVGIDTLTMSLIVKPFSLINVTVSVDQSALSVGFVILPVAVVSRAIKPNLDPSAVSDFCVFDPFSFVFGSVFEFYDRAAGSLDPIGLGRSILKLS